MNPLELLREVAVSGVVFEDPRVGYVEVQIDRETWDALAPYRDALLPAHLRRAMEELLREDDERRAA